MSIGVPITCSWEEIAANGGAYRAALSTVGGAQLQDDEDFPPSPDGDELDSATTNQIERQVAALNRTAIPLSITVDWSAGSPFIAAMTCPNSTLITSDITVIKNATGDVTLQWASASKIVPLVTDPSVTVNSLSLGSPNAAVMVVASPPANTVQIRIQVKDGSSLTNARFTVRG